jgi:hypothetical protein
MRIKKEVFDESKKGNIKREDGLVINTRSIEELEVLLKWFEKNTNYTWKRDYDIPTQGLYLWETYEQDTCLNVSDGVLSYSSIDFFIDCNPNGIFDFNDIWEDESDENHEDEITIDELENTITRVKEVISSNNYILENLEKKLSVAKFNKKREDNIVNDFIDRTIKNIMNDMLNLMEKKSGE